MTPASNALLLLVGVPENYRLGGPAFQRLHEAHPRVQVRIVHDQAEFARQVTQADAVIGSRPYLKNQRLHLWRREGQDWLPLHGQTIAILGVGSGGGNLARVCKTGFGMMVLGMTRTPREIPHVDRAFGQSGLLSVLPEADFVVLCLPHTPETRHIINAAAFDAMKPTTPHIATESVKLSDAVVDFWCENLRRFAENQPLLGVVDRRAGY